MNQYLYDILKILTGAIITFVITYIANRKRFIRYRVMTNRVAFSSQDSIFGTLEVKWNGNEAKNIYFSQIELENTSGKDLENFDFKIYTHNTTNLLKDSGRINNSTESLFWSARFNDQIKVNEGTSPTDIQRNYFSHNREYTVPVFNRGEQIVIEILSHRIVNDEHWLFAETRTKGLSFKYSFQERLIHGIPVKYALPLGFVSIAMISILIVIENWPIVIVAVLCMFLGLFAQTVGSSIFKSLKSVQRIFIKN